MKRALFILLSILTLFSLSACGETNPRDSTGTSLFEQTTEVTSSSQNSTSPNRTDENSLSPDSVNKSDSRADTVSECFYYNYLLNLDVGSAAFDGGCVKYFRTDFLYGNDHPVFGKDDYNHKSLACRFHENSKILYPLCFDFTCTHDSADCFANSDLFFLASGSNAAATADENTVSFVVAADPVYAIQYSQDGTQLKKIELDPNDFVKHDGSLPKNIYANGLSLCLYGDKVYMDVGGYAQNSELELWASGTQNDLDRWIISFDFETFEFVVVCNYLAPDPYSKSFEITECSDNYIGVDYDGRYAFCIDVSDGTYVETDCAELFDSLVANGTIQQGDYVESIYPISKIMLTGGMQGITYCDIETGDKLDVDLLKRSSLEPISQYEYGGDVYFYCVDQGENSKEYIRYIRKSDGQIFELSRTFDDGTYYISGLTFTSGNGLVYQYYDTGTISDNERYTVIEDEIEVTYQKALRFVYVSYEDILDGQIDEPWYYDAETGMFVQK